MKKPVILFLLFALLLTVPVLHGVSEAEGSTEQKNLRILATSDLHGMFVPWDYARNTEYLSGSMAQLATAVNQYRLPNTLLVDAGDTIQDNSAELFLGDADVHPMVQAMNALEYDLWVSGNHDYNYGMDILRKTMSDLHAKVLIGNVYDETGTPVADRCAIFDVDGIRVAFIGMVTPNIVRWDAANLKDCTVTDPLTETRAAIDSIRGQYDVLIGVFHMGLNNELSISNSGVTDILNACPEFDVMVSSHEHNQIDSMEINGTLVVQNKNHAQTMSVIDLTLEKDSEGWSIAEKHAESISVADFAPDPALKALLAPYHERALADAQTAIGRLEGGSLVSETGTAGIPEAQLRDTALMDLVNRVLLYYSGAKVSAAALTSETANLLPGIIRKCDIASVYVFPNTLYKLQISGSQLKLFLEDSAACFNTMNSSDSAIAISPDRHFYEYLMFEGISYEINLSNAPGCRIENLRWPDGTSVRESELFELAVDNYTAGSRLLTPGVIFEANNLPTLLEQDVHSEIGGIPELIRDYIVRVKDGVIKPECNDNWRIVCLP